MGSRRNKIQRNDSILQIELRTLHPNRQAVFGKFTLHFTSQWSYLKLGLLFCCAILTSVQAVTEQSFLGAERHLQISRLATGVPLNSWKPLSKEQAQHLYDKANTYLERYQKYHLPHGLNADVVWSDSDRSKVEMYTGLGDSALWTGFYIAALAFRYSEEPNAATLQDIHDALDHIELLTEISGRTGYVARYAGPLEDPHYEPYYRVYGGGPSKFRTGLGRRAYQGAEPYEELVWLGKSSRDTYDGMHFAFTTLWVYVDEDTVRERVRFLVERIGSRLSRDLFFAWDGYDRPTRPTYLWRLAWIKLMRTVHPEKFSSTWIRFQHRYSNFVFRIRSVPTLSVSAYRYYPNNLRMTRLFTLAMLEEHPRRKKRYLATLRNMYQDELQSHLNAHFAAIYLLVTGNEDLSAIATLHNVLLDFPDEKWLSEIDHREQYQEWLVNERHAGIALIPSKRVHSDFIWQRAPGHLYGGRDEHIEYPGIDMFLPYWMGRVAGVIDPP